MTAFEHGEEETHFCCSERLKELGEQAPCCECTKHGCPIEKQAWTACMHRKGETFYKRRFLFWKELWFKCDDCPARFPYYWKEILEEVSKHEAGLSPKE